MSIKEGKIVGYTYKVYYDVTLLHDASDYNEYFDTEEEAREDAESYVDRKIEDWKADGSWEEDDDRDYFDIVIMEDIEDDD